jgi:hypothetical protein
MLEDKAFTLSIQGEDVARKVMGLP